MDEGIQMVHHIYHIFGCRNFKDKNVTCASLGYYNTNANIKIGLHKMVDQVLISIFSK